MNFNYLKGVNKENTKQIQKNTIIKSYKFMSLTVLLYGSETWKMTTKAEQRLQNNEMRFLMFSGWL